MIVLGVVAGIRESQLSWRRPTPDVGHALQPLRIDFGHGPVADVDIGVDPTPEPNRIALHISPNRRVIVSEVVVIEPRLRIVVLARVSSGLWAACERAISTYPSI